MFCVALLALAIGCADATDADSSALAAANAPPDTRHAESWEGCPSQAETGMYDATDASIHELVTCGGMQVSLANNMLAILLVSNDRMYDDATRQDLKELTDFLPKNPFERVDDENWQVTMGPGSTFTMRFVDPTNGETITADPFDMESYLVGLRASYELTFEEMWNRPEEKNRWEFHWDSPGPLAHLVNGGEPLPRTFEMELSLNDIIEIVYFGGGNAADLGPFDSILDIEMVSEVVLEDTRGVRMANGSEDAVVRYEVGIRQQSVRAINGGAPLDFDLRGLTTTLEGAEMTATESTLQYGTDGVGQLTGLIAYETPQADVVSDFGEGASYPEETWSCRGSSWEH
jgi:hypothetical protein